MRRVSIAAIVILTVLFGVLYLLIESEKESNEFGNYEEMAESGLINLGWIPAFIPKSAYDIKEEHRVDVSRIHVELKFDASDINSFEVACNKLHEAAFICANSGYPVKVLITNGNYAIIRSVQNGT
ncbi:MAG: hypothetical protein WBN81_18070 [Gammaproteobacteria bacterium]|jgi:hypothetical protein